MQIWKLHFYMLMSFVLRWTPHIESLYLFYYWRVISNATKYLPSIYNTLKKSEAKTAPHGKLFGRLRRASFTFGQKMTSWSKVFFFVEEALIFAPLFSWCIFKFPPRLFVHITYMTKWWGRSSIPLPWISVPISLVIPLQCNNWQVNQHGNIIR